jgi:hypothetical protein
LKSKTPAMDATLAGAIAQLTAMAKVAQTKVARLQVYRLTDTIAQEFLAAVEKEFAEESKPKRRKAAKP